MKVPEQVKSVGSSTYLGQSQVLDETSYSAEKEAPNDGNPTRTCRIACGWLVFGSHFYTCHFCVASERESEREKKNKREIE